MAAALAGLRILVTRPSGQAAGIIERLHALGAEVVHWPALIIEPLSPVGEDRRRLADWGDYDLALFVSANAVRHARPWLGGRAPRLAAIGRRTAGALAEAGLSPALVAPPPYNSEALLALPELQSLAGRRLLLLRGEGGRRQLADTLRARGARLDEVACYRRRAGDPASLQPLLAPLPECAMATSGEALAALEQVLGARRAGMDLVAGGTRVADRAEGWRRVIVAEHPGDEAMTAAVLQSRQDIGKPTA